MKPRQLSWKWLLVGLVVLLLAGLAVLPRQIGASANLRDRVVAALSAWTGATVTLTEPLSVRYFPPLSLRGGFVLTNATKLPLVSSITAKDAKISLSVPDLLAGRIKIDALRLGRPKITLKEAGAPAMPPETARTLVTDVLASAPVRTVRIGRGTVVAASGALLLNALDARLDASAGSGALSALGSFDFRGETVRFAIDSGRISETKGVQTAPVTLTVTSDSVAAKASGTARSGEGFALVGDMQVEMSSARRFLNRVGMPLPPGDSLQGLSASGPFYWNGTTLTFDDAALTLDGNAAVGLLAITTGARPRVEGTLAFEHLVLDPYLGGDAPAAVDGPLFDWALLKYFDADLRISAGEISVLAMDLGHGGFTVTAKEGVISSEVGELELCGGQAAGRVGLDLSAPRTKASLAGSLSGVAVEPCLQPFGLGAPIRGVGSLKIDVSTGGHTKEELIRGLAGDLKIAAQNGAVPIDFPKLMRSTGVKVDGWNREGITPFDSLDADCRLSAGHIWCQSFKMQTGSDLVSGSGSVDVGQQTLDWDLLIANPVAQLSASQLVMEAPPRVTIRGPLTQPLIQRANHSTLGDGSTQSDTGNAPVSPR
jgi:AsmA protein